MRIAAPTNQTAKPVVSRTRRHPAINIRSGIGVDDPHILAVQTFCSANQAAGVGGCADPALHIATAVRGNDLRAVFCKANQTAGIGGARITGNIPAAGLANSKSGGDHPAVLPSNQRADMGSIGARSDGGDEVVL